MTINERAPEDGDTSFANVSDRLSMPLDEAMMTQRAVRKVLPDPVDDAIVLRCIELALRAPTGAGPDWLFLAVPEGKTVKNRIHFDLTPDDQRAEVVRLVGMGARPVDVGQGAQSWVVLADPEGNEFCILAAG